MFIVNQLEVLTQRVNDKPYDYWLHHDLFSAQWWLIIILSALFYSFFISSLTDNE
ncbi:hypothetical protein MMB68_22900 [Priestia sp. Y58]|uniref:hypothetical protein n=1 Tax=Priestia TaxID=2800373 RepID=UPI001C8DC6D2|nr:MULTISPECIES: hypothetical protein [Priestia]MBX9983698.1 hypothetical protein [Priestia aryabhattai]MBY0003659.1 hypothetical protein [Priestia aryabhattai]MDG0032404.1 hypothetical protein [Priestia sp. Y58]MDG0058193.1 hypothetical protein [Priestia sp. P5]MDN3363852.1 hypothetical protein [Priestia megaterium]